MSDPTQSAVEFTDLILGLSSAALFYLGEGDIEGKSHKDRNLPLAKQNIDIIEMLQIKTKVNLSTEEAKLISEVLHDLRIKFIGQLPKNP